MIYHHRACIRVRPFAHHPLGTSPPFQAHAAEISSSVAGHYLPCEDGYQPVSLNSLMPSPNQPPKLNLDYAERREDVNSKMQGPYITSWCPGDISETVNLNRDT